MEQKRLASIDDIIYFAQTHGDDECPLSLAVELREEITRLKAEVARLIKENESLCDEIDGYNRSE